LPVLHFELFRCRTSPRRSPSQDRRDFRGDPENRCSKAAYFFAFVWRSRRAASLDLQILHQNRARVDDYADYIGTLRSMKQRLESDLDDYDSLRKQLEEMKSTAVPAVDAEMQVLCELQL
jgi:hypothetical protein